MASIIPRLRQLFFQLKDTVCEAVEKKIEKKKIWTQFLSVKKQNEKAPTINFVSKALSDLS